MSNDVVVVIDEVDEVNTGEQQSSVLAPAAINIEPLKEQHAQILKDEKTIITKEDEILNEIKKQITQIKSIKKPDDPTTNNEVTDLAVELFMKMVRVYFVLLLKFGKYTTEFLFPLIFGKPVADQIITGPIDVAIVTAELSKRLDQFNNAANRELIIKGFDALSVPVKSLLDKISKIFIDIGTKNSTKLVSLITTSLSAFPPIALFFDFATLGSVAVNTMISGLHLTGVSFDSFNEIKEKITELSEITLDKAKTAAAATTTAAITDNPTATAAKSTDLVGSLMKFSDKMKDKGTQLFNKGDATFAGQIAKHPVVADTYQTFKGLIKDPTTITSKLTDLGNNFSGFASKVYKESETRRANLAIEIKQLEEQISELKKADPKDDAKITALQTALSEKQNKQSSILEELQQTATAAVTTTDQKGGASAIRNIQSQTKRISSRILQSLKCFRNSDKICIKRKSTKKNSNKRLKTRKYKNRSRR